MNGELARMAGFISVAERDRNRALEQVRTTTDVAAAKVMGVVEVGQVAMLGALQLSMMKHEAALMVPEDAAKFDLIATTAVMGMAQQVNRLAGQ